MVQNERLIIAGPDNATVVDVPYPTLPADDYMVVQTTAVAINPTDWKHLKFAGKIGCLGTTLGCDYAGRVVEVGLRVTKPFKEGDRVCGPVNGANPYQKDGGTFAKYIIVKGDLQIPIPDNITDEQAATLGIALTTVGQGLYQTLGLPLPTHPAAEKAPILIYGGSTAMGITGIQFAALSGFSVIATASPHNHEYLRRLGAAHVVDYKSAMAVEEVCALAGGRSNLRLAWDCHSDQKSAAFCAKCLSAGEPGAEAQYASLLPGVFDAVSQTNPKVRMAMSLYYAAFNEDYDSFGIRMPAVSKDYAFTKMFWDMSRALLADGKLKPIRTIVNRGGSGLDGVLVGMKELKDGKVSAAKLVYTI